jgi:HlyD family secretion protein
MRRLNIRWYQPVVLGFLGVMLWSTQRTLRAGSPTAPRPDDVAEAARTVPPPSGLGDLREAGPPPGTISGYGVVEPAAPETRVAAAVSGRIARVAVVEGQRVGAGEVLVELDATVERAALAAARADVDAAKARLARTVRGNRAEDIRAASADADTARARAELTRGVAERLERVAGGGGATLDEVERARRQAEADDATARAAEARRQAVLAGSRAEDVQLARAELAAAEARRDQTQAAADRLVVRAPLAAEVLQVKVRAGEYYQTGGDPLAVLGDTSRMTVRMDVDERDVGRVVLGAPVVVRASAYPGVDFAGRVVEVGRRMGRKNVRADDPAERNDTKVLEVVVALDAPLGLVSGQRTTCYVAGRTPHDAAAQSAP